MTFEWDTNKDLGNQAKHGVSFTQASIMIEAVGTQDAKARTIDGEGRDLWIGRIDGAFYAAITTERGGVCRIISCRPARDEEKAQYGQGK